VQAITLTNNESIDNQKIKSLILKIIDEQKPESIRQLVTFATRESEFSEEILLLVIQELEDQKKLQFNELFFPESLAEYVFSVRAIWYWIILFLSILTVFFVFALPENLVPQIYARNVLGAIFVLYLPGFALIKILYPVSVPLKTSYNTLDTIERIGLNLGLSLVVTPIIGLILYYTPWGINLTLITFSLLIVTILLATSGILREYQAKKELFLRRVRVVTGYAIKDNAIVFFNERGLMRKRCIIVQEILVSGITSIDSRDCELSVFSNGGTNIFLMRNAESASVLRDSVRGMIVGKSN
jgi:hypothetical protein